MSKKKDKKSIESVNENHYRSSDLVIEVRI
jgi:hypothetical protein